MCPTPGAANAAALAIGPDLSRVRLRNALQKLSDAGAGLSKKGLKSLEKEYRAAYGNRID